MAPQKKKQVEQPVETEDEHYFVSITRPLELRRQMLECSRKVVYCLQDYQRLVLIRARKLEELKKLRNSTRELSYLNNKLTEKLPKHKEFSIAVRKDSAKRVLTPKQANIHISKDPLAKKPIKEKSELEKLEDSLAAIESKLKDLK